MTLNCTFDRHCQLPATHGLHCQQHHDTLLSLESDEALLRRPLPGTLPIRPRRPKRIRDQLHALAETPGLTPDQYEREKAEILRGETT